jgi:hypothetical protein
MISFTSIVLTGIRGDYPPQLSDCFSPFRLNNPQLRIFPIFLPRLKLFIVLVYFFGKNILGHERAIPNILRLEIQEK